MAEPHENAMAMLTALAHGDDDVVDQIVDEVTDGGLDHAMQVAGFFAGAAWALMVYLSESTGQSVDTTLANLGSLVASMHSDPPKETT